MIIWFVQARQYQYLCEAKAARAETEAEVLSAEYYDADAKDVGGEGEHEELRGNVIFVLNWRTRLI